MSLRRVLLLLPSLLVGCAALTLPPNRPLARPVAFRGAYEEFPSGLRLVVHEAPQVSWVTMNVSYRVGATDEPEGKEGLAHLVEHLTFQARPGGERTPRLSSLLLASGAHYNAVTSYDGTDYFFTAPPEQFPLLVALEAERLRAPLENVTEEDFRVARDVVVAELRQRYETSPEGAQQRWLHEVLLPGHPYGRTSGGTPESLQRLTLEDARAFVQAHYTPAHVVLGVSGPLASDAVRSTVTLGFAELTSAGKAAPTPPVRRVPPPFPPELRQRAPLVVRHGPVEYPRLWLVWTLPGLFSGMTPHAFAAEGMLGHRLATQLAREEQAHSTSVSLEVLDGVTLLIARIDLMKAEDAEDVADLALDQLVDLVRDPGRLGGLTLGARSMLLTEAFMALEQFPAREATRFLRATGKADYVTGWPQQIREGLSRDLGPYLYKYVRRDRARLLLMVPEQAGAERPQVAERFSPLAGPEDFGDEELILPPGALEVRQVARPPGLEKAERFTLGNGLRVVALRRGGMPLLEARLWVRTRTPDTEGALTLSRVAVHGSYMSAGRKWYHGAKVGARTALQLRDEGQPVLAVSAPAGNLIHVLEDMQQWMWDAEVELRPFEDVQAWQVRQLEREASRSDTRAERSLMARLFPGHPYGLAPSVEEAKRFTASQATAWVEAELNPDRATLLLVGDLPPLPQLRDQVAEMLGRWRGKGRQVESPPAPPLPSQREVVVVDRHGATQAELQVGLRWPELSAQEDAAASALVWLLEHRLGRQLRERLGLTYGVRVSHEARPRASLLRVRAAVERSAAAGAVEQLLAELGTLEAELLPREVVERARWQVARGYDLRFQTAAAAVERLLELERLGRPPDYWERYPEAIAAVTPEAVQGLARRLSLGSEVVVILGDAVALRPQLESAGFQVEVLGRSAPSTFEHQSGRTRGRAR
ncbi:pitrilysin family protein [Hyalangium sp.]|uniref:M16 family metallopeptidase n=1 Tax=Hyalangium sp. TaxID=2028555 RepID=UPI002D6AB032|nr:pitrilysin family protein [Hyalangium sp.]HYH95154.1 pitrilysin family protein [Hyalangium sp.]